jgi:hypothetical protein
MVIDEALTEAVEKLKLAAVDNRHVEAAQMQLINMTEVMQAAGVNWRECRERIRVGTTSFLKGCLADGDIVIPCGDGFLIIFANGNIDEVTRQTETIRELLIQFYLGQDGLERLQVQSKRQSLPAKALHALASDELIIERRPENEHKFMFAPVWCARREIIAAYFCSPFVESDGRRIYAYDEAFVDTGASAADDFLATDLEALDVVEMHLQTPNEAEIKPMIGAPVHASTLRKRTSRVAYLRRLNQVPPEATRRLMVRISEITRGTPVTTIADWVGQLRGKARNIVLQFHHSEPLAAQIEQTGANGAGFFAPRQLESAADASMVRAHVRAWAMKLAQAKMAFFLDDLCNAATARRAVELGANFLSSSVLWPCVSEPGEVRRAPLATQMAR